MHHGRFPGVREAQRVPYLVQRLRCQVVVVGADSRVERPRLVSVEVHAPVLGRECVPEDPTVERAPVPAQEPDRDVAGGGPGGLVEPQHGHLGPMQEGAPDGGLGPPPGCCSRACS